MKLVTYKSDNNIYVGQLNGNSIFTLFKYNNQNIAEVITNNSYSSINSKIDLHSVEILPPIPNPTSLRDAYAFRQHVEHGRKNRGLEMIPEYDNFPVYYYSNHKNITGPGTINIMPNHIDKLDFELEIAIVIGKYGINIDAKDADEYIFGYMLMNDWSARSIQIEEMKLNLGPAKGKDFATSFGPYLATRKSLRKYLVSTPAGEKYDLDMKCKVNDIEISKDNLQNMSWTFAEIIERISYGTPIYPGDIIGSGTCATGCFLELNYGNSNPQWLKHNDNVSISATELGTLNNKINLLK